MPDTQPLNLNEVTGPASDPATGKFEKQENRYLAKELARESSMKGTVHFWKRAFLCICFIILIAVILIRVWCLISPIRWQWLSDDQTTKIDEFFVHGTIGAIVAGYLGKYFREENKAH